jgi:hypothetical protein
VQSKAHDGDTITTPAPKNAEDTPRTQLMTHKGSGELMIGIGNDRDRVRFRDAVKSVINRNLKVTQKRFPKALNCRPKRLKKKGVSYESCTYARRRDDGKSGTTKRCESENKNCLLLSARRNLGSAVTKDSWIKIWKDLAPAPVAARYLPGE